MSGADRDLIARLAANDEEAAAEFVARFRGRVEMIARRHGVGSADCQDVWQDVVIDAFRQIRTVGFELKKSLPSWVYSLARGHSVNHLRKKGHQQLVPLEGADLEAGAGGPPAEESAIQNVLLVNQALARLPSTDCVVLLLKEQHGYTLREIEQMLDVPIATLWDWLARARTEFRRFIRAETDTEPND